MKSRWNRNRTFIATTILAASVLVLSDSRAAFAQDDEKVTYDDHVQPIFRARCFTCHNQDKREGDLDLTNYTNLMQGGGSGPVIEPGDSDASWLFNLISHDEEPAMPPESDPIPDAELGLVKRWIDNGALENQGSKSTVPARPSFNFALDDTPSERPAVAPLPGRLVLEPQTRTERVAACGPLATSPWAPLIAVGSQKQVLLYNSTNLELVGVLPFPEGSPTILKFSRNGSLLLAGGGRSAASGRVVIWNVQNGERIIEVGDELDAVLAADISSDHKLVALGGPQKIVRVYSTMSGELIYEIKKHTDWICSVEFSPDGVLLATGDRNGGLFAWESFTGREYLTFRGHSGCITDVSWRIDSNILASCSEDTTIRLWELENGGQVRNWGAHGGGALSVEFTRDGRLISCGRDRVAKLWKQDGGQIIAYPGFGDIALHATFCDESERAIAGDWTGEIRVWPAADGNPVGQLTSNPARIDERLAAAQSDVQALKSVYDPLATALQAATDRLAQVSGQLEQQQNDLNRSQQELAEVKQRFEKVSAVLTGNQEKVVTLESEVTSLKTAVPLLLEAAAQAESAAKTLANDEEATNIAAQIRATANVRSERLKTADTELVGILKMVAEQQSQVTTDQSEITQLTTRIESLTMAIPETQKLIKPAQDSLAAAGPPAVEARTAWENAEAAVLRWTDEVAFTERINVLFKRRDELRQQLVQRQSEMLERQAAADSIQSQLSAAQVQLNQLTQQQTQLVSQRDEMQTQLATLTESKSESEIALKSIAEKMTRLQTTITALKPVVDAAQQAVEAATDDAELAAVATQLGELFKTRNEQLTTAAEQRKLRESDIASLVANITAKNEQFTLHQTKLTEMQKAIVSQQTTVDTHQQALADQQTQVAQAEQIVAAAQTQVDEVGQQIAAEQGLN